MRGFYIIAIAALALVGCKHNLPETEGQNVPVEITIMPVVDGEDTKSASTSTFVIGKQMGLWVTASARTNAITPISANADNYTERVKYTHNGTAFINQEDKLTFPNVNTLMGLYSVYPYLANANGVTAGKLLTQNGKVGVECYVEQDQNNNTTNFENSDILTATRATTGIAVANASGVALKYFHRMSLLKIKIKVPKQYGDDAIATSAPVELAIKSISRFGFVPLTITGNDEAVGFDPSTLDPALPSAVAGRATDLYTVANCLTATNPTPDGSGMMEFEFEAIVVPQTIASGEVFVQADVTYAGVKRSFNFLSGGVSLTAGRTNSLTLSVNNLKPITLGDLTLKKWEYTSSNGQMQFMKVQNTFTTVAAFVPAGYTSATAKTNVGDFPVKVAYNAAQLIYSLKFDIYYPGPKEYPFKINQVVFSNGANSVTYNATNLTVTAKGNYPVVLTPVI